MARAEPTLLSFNRGLVARSGLARVDVERVQLSAELQTNWIPQSLGPMSLRPGLEHILGSLAGAKPKYLPFVFAVDDTALLEFTAGKWRPLVNEAPVTIPATAAVDPPAFSVGLPGWTIADDAGALSFFGYNGLDQKGTRYAHAKARVLLTIPPAEFGVVHALKLVVVQDTVQFRIGTTAGAQNVRAEATLGVGTHILAFTPAGDVWIEVSHTGHQYSIIEHITFYEGDLEFTTPYTLADLPLLRFDQSADVVYLACKGYQQRKLIRRDRIGSWSYAVYAPNDGPFRGLNTNGITLTPGAVQGETNVTASRDVFKQTHEGALLRIESSGQFTVDDFVANDQYSLPVRIFGVGPGRNLTITITGVWVGTMKLQRSFGEPGNWEDVQDHTGNGVQVYNDALDNQLVYYRIGFKPGGYTSGTAHVTLSYPTGSNTGIARILDYLSPTLVRVGILQEFGNTTPSENWYEGAWSDYRGWPSSVLLYEGRLWWQGKDFNWGSISDEFESFDDSFPGDAGPIQRSIGSGPVDVINWAMGLQRMILGGGGAEHNVSSSSLDEPLTPTNYNIKPITTQGSATVDAVRIDGAGLFVQRSKQKVYEISPADGTYSTTDVGVLVPKIGKPGIVALGVQRQPDTRLHAVRSDGTVAMLVYNKAENVKAWIEIEMGAVTEKIVDIVVLPGDGREDRVYYVIQTDGEYFLTRWAQEDECQGGLLNLQADLFVSYDGVPVSTLAVPAILEGRTLVMWADGKALPDVVVDEFGMVTFEASYSKIVVGLGYRARYKSSKLGRITQRENSVKRRKNINGLGLTLENTHQDGLYYGPDFDNLDPMPDVEDHEIVDADKIWEHYDKDAFEFNGDWDVDSRVCLEARAPKPCTVLALTMLTDSHEKG